MRTSRRLRAALASAPAHSILARNGEEEDEGEAAPRAAWLASLRGQVWGVGLRVEGLRRGLRRRGGGQRRGGRGWRVLLITLRQSPGCGRSVARFGVDNPAWGVERIFTTGQKWPAERNKVVILHRGEGFGMKKGGVREEWGGLSESPQLL